MDSASRENLKFILDLALERMNSHPGVSVIAELADSLNPIYDLCVIAGESAQFKEACQSHLLHDLIMRDPYSRRAFEKPRRYAGDAEMLDYIYKAQVLDLDAKAFTIHCATTRLPNGQSILWRQEYLARLIASAASKFADLRVLSIASGHMRELDYLRVISDRRDFSITALDQDGLSLATSLRDNAGYTIEALNKSILHIIKGGLSGRDFELVYAAGLYYYLNDKVAVSLASAAYRHIVPGGQLSIGNFSKDNQGRGFMVGLMDWELILRSEAEIEAILRKACPGADIRILRDPPGSIVYGEAHKPN
jgi:hypothetical protein